MKREYLCKVKMTSARGKKNVNYDSIWFREWNARCHKDSTRM